MARVVVLVLLFEYFVIKRRLSFGGNDEDSSFGFRVPDL